MKFTLDLSQNLGNFGPLFYNNTISVPLLILCSYFFKENLNFQFLNSIDWFGGIFIFLLIIDGSIISFASFWCIKVTSATTYSLVGSLNKMPLSLLGEVLFREYSSNYGRLGVLLVVIGGAMYGFSPTEKKDKPTKDRV